MGHLKQQPPQTTTYQAAEQPFTPPPPPYTATAYPQPSGPAPPQDAIASYTGPTPNQGAAFYPAPPAAFSPGPTAPARLLPPTFNGYCSWKSLSTFHLGTSGSHKTHAVKVHDSLFSSKQTLALHAGPTADQHPVLASAESSGWCRDRDFVVTVRARAAGGLDTVVRVERVKKGMLSAVFRFEVEVGGGGGDGEKDAGWGAGGRETFEWRSSHGEDVKEVAEGSSYGWKLVRLGDGGGVSGMAVAGPSGGHGVASDGREIVAVVAHNASWSMTKGFRFAFLGSGLTGVFGDAWELVTVASALKLWYKDVEQSAAAGS